MEKFNLLNLKVTPDERKQITGTFNTLCTDEDRIKFTLNVMLEYNIIPVVHQNPKNAEEAEKFRAQGNKIYVSKPLTNVSCIEALKLYTESIANAPCSSKQLALAYGNRSAVLLKLHRYEECIRDIERALVLSCPDNSKAKLYMRKAESLKALQKKNSSLEYTNGTELNNTNSYFEIKSYNNEIPCASDALSLIYNEKYGRHIVANRRINPGETIITETYYSKLLHQDKLYTHCSNCLEVCYANIPCNSCIYAMYCSEECRIEQWKKCHDMECAVFPPMLKMKYSTEDLFSLRLAIQAVKESNIDDLRKELEEVDTYNDPRTKGFSKNGIFESNQYRSILSLITNTETRSFDDLFTRCLDSSFILYFLATCTNMFGKPLKNDLSLLMKNPDVIFVGSLVLRHQQVIPSNAHSISEEHVVTEYRGACILPFSSLLNHNCNANTTRVDRGKNMSVITIYPIKPGEQIFCDYGYQYGLDKKSERQMKLLRQFHFNCNCVACREDWPEYYNLKSAITPTIDNDLKSKILTMLLKFNDYLEIVKAGDLDDKPYILPDIIEMIEILHEKVPLPNREITNAVEVMKQIYALQGNVFRLPQL
ncbi:protein-lysine N-methyltransferase SMYD4 [Megalopta genalis]|uniref:protein-lysine N-methyltransferase SMYD4 n=1 Tax=Megalopta genalis TaxID=115081 RepID=UPI003FCFB1F1